MQIGVQLWAKRLMTRMAWFRLAYSNTKTYARFKHLARSVLVVTKNILSAWNLPMHTWKCSIQVRIFNLHGLIIEELHFASHLFIVFSSFGGSLGSVVRYCHLPPSLQMFCGPSPAWCPRFRSLVRNCSRTWRSPRGRHHKWSRWQCARFPKQL